MHKASAIAMIFFFILLLPFLIFFAAWTSVPQSVFFFHPKPFSPIEREL